VSVGAVDLYWRGRVRLRGVGGEAGACAGNCECMYCVCLCVCMCVRIMGDDVYLGECCRMHEISLDVFQEWFAGFSPAALAQHRRTVLSLAYTL
jgi:hypothetical protein